MMGGWLGAGGGWGMGGWGAESKLLGGWGAESIFLWGWDRGLMRRELEAEGWDGGWGLLNGGHIGV